MNLLHSSATEIRDRVNAREISAVELVRACTERIEAEVLDKKTIFVDATPRFPVNLLTTSSAKR